MPRQKSLHTYRQKRDFGFTPEPFGEEVFGMEPSEGRLFVVQKHNASHLHYDFRLEVDGVLKSWAIPKGPSTDPKQKRLAVPTEDHPISYAHFEGTIPEGQYGAGTVVVWDIGTYENITRENGSEIPMDRALVNGRVSIQLNGKKLRGGYSLTRFKSGEGGAWLLIKKQDQNADAIHDILTEKPQSVLSGRTIEEIRQEA